jgi:hypothetical protein
MCKIVAIWAKCINILSNWVDKQCLVNLPSWTPYILVSMKNSAPWLVYLWLLLTKYCTQIFNLYADMEGKKTLYAGATGQNMLQFKPLSQFNYSYLYDFGILETGKTSRYLCKGLQYITNRSAMKCYSTLSNGTKGRSFLHIPQFRSWNSNMNHVLFLFIGCCCLRRLEISITSLRSEKLYAAQPSIRGVS